VSTIVTGDPSYQLEEEKLARRIKLAIQSGKKNPDVSKKGWRGGKNE